MYDNIFIYIIIVYILNEENVNEKEGYDEGDEIE